MKIKRITDIVLSILTSLLGVSAITMGIIFLCGYVDLLNNTINPTDTMLLIFITTSFAGTILIIGGFALEIVATRRLCYLRAERLENQAQMIKTNIEKVEVILDKVENLFELLNKGVLTKEEYIQQKNDLLRILYRK